MTNDCRRCRPRAAAAFAGVVHCRRRLRNRRLRGAAGPDLVFSRNAVHDLRRHPVRRVPQCPQSPAGTPDRSPLSGSARPGLHPAGGTIFRRRPARRRHHRAAGQRADHDDPLPGRHRQNLPGAPRRRHQLPRSRHLAVVHRRTIGHDDAVGHRDTRGRDPDTTRENAGAAERRHDRVRHHRPARPDRAPPARRVRHRRQYLCHHPARGDAGAAARDLSQRTAELRAAEARDVCHTPGRRRR